MKKYKPIYICDVCHMESDDPTQFREVIGNIIIPDKDKGGIVGNNLWNINNMPEEIRNKLQNQEISYVKLSDTTGVTSSMFCISCLIKAILPDLDEAGIHKLTSELKEQSQQSKQKKNDVHDTNIIQK